MRQGPGTGTDAAAKEGRRAAGSGPGIDAQRRWATPSQGSHDQLAPVLRPVAEAWCATAQDTEAGAELRSFGERWEASRWGA